jgi:predicted dehydrogenase
MTGPTAIKVFLQGDAGIGTQRHQSDMYRPAFERHPAFEIVASAEEADVVSIAVPLDERAEAIGAAVRAGRHVLADKPMTATTEEAVALRTLAEQHGVVVVPAHHLRLGGAVNGARAAVRGGRVGLPWNVQADFLAAGGDPAPTGELVNLALYPLDVLNTLLGLPVLRVHAVGGPSLVTLLLDHEHGVTSTVLCGRIAALPPGIAVHRYRISGTHGVLALDALKPALDVVSSSGTARRWTGGSTVDKLLDVLAAGVRTGRAAIGPADAVATQRVVEAARQSLGSGRPVALERGSS